LKLSFYRFIDGVSMKVVIQRVRSASVSVAGEIVGAIEHGLLVLLGVADGDQEEDLQYVLEKTIGLRIFEDGDGKMNLSVVDVAGGVLVVSQFTLLADTRKGKRPGFNAAAAPEIANRFYEQFAALVRQREIEVATGSFGANMQVSLVNDGPVTIIIDSRNR
jgi:D-tyrosyl-tRNA(Tyr) deacylase